ncbi:MAG TPA: SDR family oxidoreductase [Sphingobium sp.]|uniref:SDR family NAD(P)-dependent oxidoreductase n=1 Tax=Sphingobium sp. TaxID=1912891 RepID=UPI002ED2F40E
MDKFLEGKVALVTGASRGLGRAIAEDFARLGALVAINYASNDVAAQDVLRSIEAKGGKAFLLKCALGSYEAAEQLTEALDKELRERTGSTDLDIIVNNAGGGPVANLDATTPEIFEKIVSDNLRAPFYVTKLLKSRLRDGGRLINVGSLGARTAVPDYIVYAMSKRALETFTIVMAKELGPRNITANCINPGLIESDANAHVRADDGIRSYLEQATPMRRFGVPSDFSGVAVSLASPQMGYVTGQIIEVAGGMSL